MDEVLEILREEENTCYSQTSSRAEGINAEVFYSRKNKSSRIRLCYICGCLNHFAKNCFYKNKNTKSAHVIKIIKDEIHNTMSTEQRSVSDSVFTTSHQQESLSDKLWLLGSGASYHMTKDTPNISWWNQNLEINKKELNALRRRVKKSTGDMREHYQKIYSKKRAIYKKEILHAKRNAWRKFCSKASSPYGTPFNSTKTAQPPSVIFNLLENPFTGNAKDSASKIFQQLYPEVAEEEINTHSTPCNFEEAFTKTEIENIIKRLPKNKAPGYDEYIDINDFRCETCDISKITRKTHLDVDVNQSSEILELIHADLCSPIQPESFGGAQYFMLLVDDFSGMYYVFYLFLKK
ncbi:hypothetical protein HNY73_005260 [Argiope bruennichi]|uniref:CCHC-type domain-containing protein n=1 Tax=Argiope bruennichi TaxID=94029 RepID=A0A8T0FKW3_ARGBR|nr:hypothetical protein HNY73_005260 [Argiope bruennichi]